MPFARFSARAVLAGTAIALVAVPFGLLLALVQARWKPLLRIDTGARDGLHAFATEQPAFVTVMEAVSAIGAGPLYWLAFGALTAWLASRALKRLALFVGVTMLGTAFLNAAVKAAVDRARPELSDPVARAAGSSFPSGHAQTATVASLVVLLVFLPVLHGRRRMLAVAGAGVYVVLMCSSRVALGVHFVSDVCAGVVLGAGWVAATTALFSAWRREEGRSSVDLDDGLEPESAARLR